MGGRGKCKEGKSLCTVDTLSHSIARKYRKAIIDDEVVEIIRDKVIGIEERYKIEDTP